MDRNRRLCSGFTMIELILVLLILSIMVAMAAPNMRGWSEGAKLRNAADDFVSAVRWARSEAIVSANVQILTIDSGTQSFSVAPESSTGIVHPSPYSQKIAMPTDFTIALASGGDGNGAIRFYPDGRTTPGVVRIASPHQEAIEIASTSPAINFNVVNRN